MGIRSLAFALIAAGALLGTRQGVADEAGKQRGWSVTFAPYIWAMRLDGDVRMRNTETDVDVGFKDLVKDLNFGAMAYTDIRTERFGVFANPTIARLKSDEDVGSLDIDVTTDTVLLSLGAFYRVAELDLGTTASGFKRTMAIVPAAGVRWTYLRLELDSRRSSDKSQQWLDPIVGVRTFTDLSQHWVLTMAGDVGGFSDNPNSSWNVQAYLSYRTNIGNVLTNIGFGYRALHQKYRKSNFEWDVTMHGPIIGTSFRF